MPAAMLNNQEPVKKRSKLVLPEPQISDTVSYFSEYLFIKSGHSQEFFLGWADLSEL